MKRLIEPSALTVPELTVDKLLSIEKFQVVIEGVGPTAFLRQQVEELARDSGLPQWVVLIMICEEHGVDIYGFFHAMACLYVVRNYSNIT